MDPISDDLGLNAEALDRFSKKNALCEHFHEKTQPNDSIRVATSAKIDYNYVTDSLLSMNTAAIKAQFNNKAKFCLLGDALKITPEILQLVFFRGASTIE